MRRYYAGTQTEQARANQACDFYWTFCKKQTKEQA